MKKSEAWAALEEADSSRILVLDGAMGTMIQRHGLTEADYNDGRFEASVPLKGNNELLSLTRPDVILSIHRAYLEAGADIVETNTFNANRISQRDYGQEGRVAELNVAAAKLARRAVDEAMAKDPSRRRFVAGSMGPTNQTASMSPKVEDPGFRAVDFDALEEAFREQARALLEGGADILLVETAFDALNVKAALCAIRSVCAERGELVPVMVSGTISDASGRLLTGPTLEALYASVRHAEIYSIGLNCALGASAMRPHVETLARIAECRVSAHPNAGLPNQFGQYDQDAKGMRAELESFVDRRLVNVLGGCCGTDPTFIREIADLVKGQKPREIPTLPERTVLAGTDVLEISERSNFVNIGERTNVSGSAKFRKLIEQENYAEALGIAALQVENGARVIDVNLDDGLIDSVAAMRKFLNLLASEPSVAAVPWMIDSSRWEVLEAGVKCVQGKPIVNSISLKEGEEVFRKRALRLRELGCAMVVMAFDEKGQATTYDRRVEIISRQWKILTEELGIPGTELFFDANILTVATGMPEHDRYALDFIETARWIKANCPGAHVVGGVSNVSFAFRGNNPLREAMHSVFLYHAIAAGMDCGIVNAGQLRPYDQIEPELRERLEDVVLCRRPDAAERLVEIAESVKNSAQAESAAASPEWRTKGACERLATSLVMGVDRYVAEDMPEVLAELKTPLAVIEGPLMEGMNRVGELFGAGKMFLPQVVKSARVMKAAVEILNPLLAESAKKSVSAGKIVLATVKGDVHDIGKNIVSVVLACNGYEVVDLGVMTPPERILEAAVAEKADAVALSGLITPSLDEMRVVAERMEEAGLKIPLLVGGATTSKLHTALRLAPAYPSGVVAQTADASRMPGVLKSLLHPVTGEAARRALLEEQAAAREKRSANGPAAKVPLDEARRRKFEGEWN